MVIDNGVIFDRIIIIIITLLSNRMEIHFALWRLHKNTIFKSGSKRMYTVKSSM